MEPLDYHADLTTDRLVAVALLLQRARRNAADRFEPEIGDTYLNLGLDAYLYGKHEIQVAAESGDYPWLSIVNSSLRFQFRIGEVLMRFWRGDIHEPRENIVEPTSEELLVQEQQGTLDLGDEDFAAGLVFRINVVSDRSGNLLEAHFVAYRGEIAECVWPIPFQSSMPLASAVRPDLPIGPDLPPAEVGPPKSGDAASNDNVEEK
ncbi:MAG: hypothetical protein ACKO1N_01365 [Erythrobacter sp.]